MEPSIDIDLFDANTATKLTTVSVEAVPHTGDYVVYREEIYTVLKVVHFVQIQCIEVHLLRR